MFTIEQIKLAHSKVKSGADFPAYIKELKQLGVLSYETFVADGHTVYHGAGEELVSSEAKYDKLSVAPSGNADQFKADLKAHQQGKTDYLAFCNDCAKSGIIKWIVSILEMTCIYYDTNGNEILAEQIPQ